MTNTAATNEVATTASTPATTERAAQLERERLLALVAYKGTVELLDAAWDLRTGRTVRFRLVPDDEKPFDRHPFADHVYRRGNRVGTRFKSAFVRIGDEQPFFSGEMMLAGGGNPLGAGMWVKFWLDEEPDRHPFSGCAGRKGDAPGDLFAAVFVEIDDDDEAINQQKRGRVERVGRRQQSLAQYAALLCTNSLFLQWLSETVRVGSGSNLVPADWWAREDHAARWMRYVCNIESRADLDRNPEAAQRFHDLVRRPYADWSNMRED